MSGRRRADAAALGFALLVLWSSSTRAITADASARGDPFAACRLLLAERPDDYDSAYCFYTAASQGRLWSRGSRVFETLMHERPDNFWLPLAFGHLQRNRDPGADLAATEALYRRAALGFQSLRHVEGEILARSNLRDILFPNGRVAEAAVEVRRVAEVGATVDDPVLKARVWLMEAGHVLDTGGDLGLSYRLLKQTERAVFPDGPYRLRRTCLNSLGLVAFRMGRIDEALALFRRLDALASAEGDAQSRANAQFNILNTESMKESFLPTPGAGGRVTAIARQTLATGLASAHRIVTLKTHRMLAALLANDRTTQGEALAHAHRCFALAAEARQPQDEAVCSWLVAMLLHPSAPEQARAAQLRALSATARANSPVTEALSASRHMQFSWLSRPRPDAIRDSLAAIDAIETLRSLQDAVDSSAELFSAWTLDYYWLSGKLLQNPAEGDLEIAFSITERLRARALMDVRERSRTPPDPGSPAVVQRRALLRDIASIQRTLMDPTLDAPARRASFDQLETLEQREQEAERQIALATRAGRTGPRFASLDEVQLALAADEALLSFQVGVWNTFDGDFGGGSWLMAITRDRRAVYRIPDRSHFAPLVPVFTGLLARGDGLERFAAVRLYADVFSTALNELPSGVRRLVLVPDGPLHNLPFDALKADVQGQPLAALYELVATPSATLWLDSRRYSAPASRHALALADPELGRGAAIDAAERQALLQRAVNPGRLPHARREGRALARYLGAVDALVGPLASEDEVKTRDLRDYEILHFAAHAVADEAHPDRSAVLLAPGADAEDGLLQAREISALRLDGRIVVLSACQTASGAVLSGEGVLSLARAFFEAGARAVIGTRWPVRDEDAASLFEVFYRELGHGASLSEALTRAKIDAMVAGRPPHAWAALVLLGDGAARPFPGGRAAHWFTPVTIVALVVAAGGLLAGGWVIALRQRALSPIVLGCPSALGAHEGITGKSGANPARSRHCE
jgi:hypothetical protein